jgi:hypothetical protein
MQQEEQIPPQQPKVTPKNENVNVFESTPKHPSNYRK